MKIPMMQSITAMNTKPKFEKVYSINTITIRRRAIAIREKCLELIKSGERCLKALSKILNVHRVTVVCYLKELDEKGFIEFTTKGGAKIVNVL